MKLNCLIGVRFQPHRSNFFDQNHKYLILLAFKNDAINVAVLTKINNINTL